MSQTYLRGIYLRLAGVLMFIVLLALGANAYLSQIGRASCRERVCLAV